MTEAAPRAWSAGPGAGLSARRRALLLVASTAALTLASPGMLPWPRLALPLGILGLAAWSLAACRTGPHRKLIEWCAGFAYGAQLMAWVGYVTPPSVVWIGFGWGLYYILAGVLLRRLLHHVGLPLSTALAYTAGEALRTLLPTPIGISWVRMGHLFADWPALRGSAAWVGVDGLGFLAAALGGLVAILLLRSRLIFKESGAKTRIRARKLGLGSRWQLAWVLGLVAVFWLLGRGGANYAAGFEAGPRLLLVQPGFTQERKRELNQGISFEELVDRQLALTLEGLAAEAEAGRKVDLVVWGETMMPLELLGDELKSALEAGRPLSWPSWDSRVEDPEAFETLSQKNEAFLLGSLRRGRFFAPGGAAAQEFFEDHGREDLGRLGDVALAAGALIYDADSRGIVRRSNGLTLWDAEGRRSGAAWKRHLVPGAESIWGLETKAWARAWAGMLMPYVPDMRAAATTGVLALEGWRFGGAVCFDNGFEDVFLEAARDGAVDFNLVASNEAWYEESVEFDQMIAMTRLWAVESGRAIVRATNSGISGGWDASGAELARLVVEGQDRAVSGTLALEVPVPGGAPVPPFATLSPWAKWISLLAPFLIMALFNLFGGKREAARDLAKVSQ